MRPAVAEVDRVVAQLEPQVLDVAQQTALATLAAYERRQQDQADQQEHAQRHQHDGHPGEGRAAVVGRGRRPRGAAPRVGELRRWSAVALGEGVSLAIGARSALV